MIFGSLHEKWVTFVQLFYTTAMFKYLFLISILALIVSCSNDQDKDAATSNEGQLEQKAENEKGNDKVYDASSVLSRSEQFFDWYNDNSRMLYKMRSQSIGSENGYHALDKKKLEEYIDWLKKTAFFSEDFIASEYDRWTTECANKMREKARKKEHFVGPPPCLFEGDVFFKMQERPSKEMIDSLEYSVVEQTDSTALVRFSERGQLNWVNQNGMWQIDAWPK